MALVLISTLAPSPVLGLFTFSASEKPLNTLNPIYNPSDYGGGISDPTVSFQGCFVGQSIVKVLPGDPSEYETITGSPTNPLTLDGTSSNTKIVLDVGFPVLCGRGVVDVNFQGPISALFSVSVAKVFMTIGILNQYDSIAITAYERTGAILGTVSTGLVLHGSNQPFGVATDDGLNKIAGVAIYCIAPEASGFAIDNFQFSYRIPGTSGSGLYQLLSEGSIRTNDLTYGADGIGVAGAIPNPTVKLYLGNME